MPGPGGPPGGGYQPANSAQKTIVAGMAPAIMGGQLMPGQQPPFPGGMPGQMPQGTPNAGFPPQQGGPQGGPQKTVMISPTEGVVSMARGGSAQQSAQVVQGASTLYWIVCLATGIAVGVLGYVIVLQT
jgi:hypothetical protein